MNEEEKKTIEELSALREKRLALDEKRHALRLKKLRPWGVALVTVSVLVICAAVTGLGGYNLYSLCQKMPLTVDEKTPPPVTNSVTVSGSGTGTVTLDDSAALDRGPLAMVLLVNTALIIAGLGAAALTVKTVAGNDNE